MNNRTFRFITVFLCAAMLLAFGIAAAGAESKTVAVTTPDQLISIELPNNSWYQLVTDEHTEMFSDGDCAIMVDLYETGEKLPAIEVADKNHELVYTAAVSTSDYVLLVVGYAHAKTDFSDMVKAINTIQLKTDKITEESVDHDIVVSDYTIRESWYTAWVSAERLNVRAGYGTDTAILTSLSRGAKLTVTGTVLKKGVEIGWSRVTLDNGTVAYVSTQFLTTSEPRPDSYKTGNTTTLYTSSGSAVTLYQYADGTWKNASGVQYWLTTSGNYTSNYGDVLYVKKPSSAPYRTGYSITLYHSTGSVVYVYEYSDGTWMDDNYLTYTQISTAQWVCSNGEQLSREAPQPEGPSRTGQFKTMYRENGIPVNLYAYSDNSWRDDNMNQWWAATQDTMGDAYGNVLYYEDPTAWHSDTPTPIGQFKTVYQADGTPVNLYAYSDNSWRDDDMNQWWSATQDTMGDAYGNILYVNNPLA